VNWRAWLLDPPHPGVVVEVRPGALGLAGLGKGGSLSAAASAELPEGTIRLSLSQPNIENPEAFDRALRTLLERSGLQSERRVGLVVPDPAGRIFLIPPTDLADPKTPLGDLVRFRLRKSLPFDVREARVAHAGGGPFHVAVAMADGVLANYEQALARAGLEAGLVELSGLALVEAMGAPAGDVLLLNWEPGYLSLFLLRAGWPILARTLPGVTSDVEELAREVSQTLVYSQERLEGGGLAAAFIRCPEPLLAGAQARLGEDLGRPLLPLDPWGWGVEPRGLPSDPGLAGALASLKRAVA
jgi:type IV pilus assembly protein PilM